jgi:hypothetical protein
MFPPDALQLESLNTGEDCSLFGYDNVCIGILLMLQHRVGYH